MRYLSLITIFFLCEPVFSQEAGAVKTFEIAKGVEIEMVYIPAMTFAMGNHSGIEDRWSESATAHEVTLTQGYWMSKYETTQELWELVLGKNPSQNKGKNLPVENVSWFEILKFVKKVQQYDPLFNLPTEAQWEHAAKAGTGKAYSRDRDLMTWHKENSGVHSHQVGTKEPNLWGVYDIHGNVGEWVLDWLEPFDESPKIDPTGPETGEMKLIKGGQFTGRPRHTYSYDRQRSEPGNKLFYVGFRLIRME